LGGRPLSLLRVYVYVCRGKCDLVATWCHFVQAASRYLRRSVVEMSACFRLGRNMACQDACLLLVSMRASYPACVLEMSVCFRLGRNMACQDACLLLVSMRASYLSACVPPTWLLRFACRRQQKRIRIREKGWPGGADRGHNCAG